MMLEFTLWVLILYVIDIIAWGVAGFLLFRLLGVSENKSYYDFSLISILYIALDYYSMGMYNKLKITIGNNEFVEYFGEDINWLLEFGWFDIAFDLIIVFIGYFIGQKIWRRYKLRTDAPHATPNN